MIRPMRSALDERPGPVVDEDDPGLRLLEQAEPLPDRVLALLAAADDIDDLGVAQPVVLHVLLVGQDEDDVVDRVVRLEALERPLEHGLALEVGELLRPAEALAGPGGDDEDGGPVHFGSPLYRPKIIFPTVVWRTEVTVISIVWPIIRRELSTTTMVPSSR